MQSKSIIQDVDSKVTLSMNVVYKCLAKGLEIVNSNLNNVSQMQVKLENFRHEYYA